MRIALIPGLVLALVAQAYILAGSLFVFAAATDVLDGALARYLQRETALGALLDSIADKMLLLASYLSLMMIPLPGMSLPIWFIGFILLYDSALMIGAWCWGALRPTTLGRLASLCQILFILWLFGCCWAQSGSLVLFYMLLILIMLTRLAVGIEYSRLLLKGSI